MVIVKYFIRSEELISRWYDEPSDRVKLIESGIYESGLKVDDFFMLLLTISLLNVIMKV